MNLSKKVKEEQSKHLNEIFLTRKDVAKELQCSLSFVDNLRRNGFLKHYSIGSLVRFKREDIIEAIVNDQNSRI